MFISKCIKDICSSLRWEKTPKENYRWFLTKRAPRKECAIANIPYRIQHARQDGFQTKQPWRTCKDAQTPPDAAIPPLGRYITTQPSVSARALGMFRAASLTAGSSVYLRKTNSTITATKGWISQCGTTEASYNNGISSFTQNPNASQT